MAGLTGFITLVAGALSFSVNQASQLYKGLFWRDNLQIVEFETRTYPDFRVVLSNGGDGPVWASKIILYWPGGSHPFAIDRLVAVNGVETVDRGSKDYDSSKYAGFLGNTTGVASAAVLDSAHILPGDEHCFLAIAYDVGNADLLRMIGHYALDNSILVRAKAEARLIYFSIHSGVITQTSFPVALLFARLQKKKCQDIR